MNEQREFTVQVRTGHGPQNLAALRTLAINALRLAGHTNIAAGLRQHARTPLSPLATLLGSYDDFAETLTVGEAGRPAVATSRCLS